MRAGVVRRNGAEKLFVVDKPADREALSCVDGALSELEQFPGALRDRVQIISYAPDAEGTTVLASGAQAQAAWAHGMRCARLLACAQTVGAVRRLHAQVVDYARTRKQFGQPIGSFQAVQHKLVNVFFELEAGERLVYRALWALAADDEDTAPVDVAVAFVRGQAWDWLINSYDVYGGTGYIDGIGVNETTRGVLELLTAVGRSNDGYERVYDAIRPGGFLAETADHV